MKRTLTLATGLAVGYVAGAHAGRERYEQIKQKTHEISRQPAVVDMRESLREHAGTATRTVAEKATTVASGLAQKLHRSEHENEPVPVAHTIQPLDATPGGGRAL